jgi:hypothetical protein
MSKRAYIDPELPYDDKTMWKSYTTNKVDKNTQGYEYNKWVSGSEVANYLLKDPMLDWLKYFYADLGLNDDKTPVTRSKKRKTIDTEVSGEMDYLQMLLNNGQKFEKLVNESIIEKFPDTITIAKNGRIDCDDYHYKLTKDAILKGVPIILQGVLIDNKTKTKGVADIIIRSDKVNDLVSRKEVFDVDKYKKAPLLNGNYHYLIIDIKWSGMTLCANGRSIRNEGRFRAYKGQLAIYNNILGSMQGYIPRYTYVLAKSWKIDSKLEPAEGWNCFDLLGTIDYASFDNEHVSQTVDAINWVRKVRKFGKGWSPMKPTVPDMYPNSSNTNDAPWTNIKKKIINETDEITKLWFVSPEHRNKALEKGVTKWSDPRCTVELLGLNYGVRTNIIHEILDINHQTVDNIRPAVIVNNDFNWQQSSAVDFYVDFETINDCINTDDMDITNSKAFPSITFMVGVGWSENNEWKYKSFIMREYTLSEEFRVLSEFTQFIMDKSKEFDPESRYIPRLFHWSPAEPSVFANANDRHKNVWSSWIFNIRWVDMYSVFTSEPIVIKGALCFKLKEIGKAMYKHGIITTKWDDDGPADGLAAMTDAIRYYEKISKGIHVESDETTMKSICKYNEIDCKVIWEIVLYLRCNNISK